MMEHHPCLSQETNISYFNRRSKNTVRCGSLVSKHRITTQRQDETAVLPFSFNGNKILAWATV